MAKLIRRQVATAAAYQSIHDFFDYYLLYNALQYLEGLIEGAAGRTVCKMDTPANMLFYTKQLEALCNAAFAICNTKNGKSIGAIPIPDKPRHLPYRPAQQLHACQNPADAVGVFLAFRVE